MTAFLPLSSDSPSEHGHGDSFSDPGEQQRARQGGHRQRGRYSGGERRHADEEEGGAPARTDLQICRWLFQGVLPGTGEDAPTIVIAAHYDSFGLAPVSGTQIRQERERAGDESLGVGATVSLLCFFSRTPGVGPRDSGCRMEPTPTEAASPSS